LFTGLHWIYIDNSIVSYKIEGEVEETRNAKHAKMSLFIVEISSSKQYQAVRIEYIVD